ncbi:MAG TPA: macro domain-containing protein [Pyrinomonadaceae bacterium]|nr:macro domain-containing protein [Pyrinomonadaceae bacterium]
MNNNCFVIMPYGEKKDVDGNMINFDDIYKYIIEKAVARLGGFECVRCDNIDEPGWVHKRMVQHISEDRVAIVDTSTLNANVFYELGVRHALKRGVTVLIQRKGTTWPFNIAGLNSISYTTDLGGADKAINDIAAFIANALQKPAHVDSLVYEVLPNLRVEPGPRAPITKVQMFEAPLINRPGKRLGLVTGDRGNIKVGDVWVNSENTEMQMDRFYGTSTSATIRYLGAKKDPETERVVEDLIANELARMVHSGKGVDPAAVIVTGPGELRRTNNVKWVFHVASVIGQPREGYQPIARIERCVTNALRRADDERFSEDRIKSVLFPIFGTGPSGGDVETHAARCFAAAVDYLESRADSSIEAAYFYVWSEQDLEACRRVVANHSGLGPLSLL